MVGPTLVDKRVPVGEGGDGFLFWSLLLLFLCFLLLFVLVDNLIKALGHILGEERSLLNQRKFTGIEK